jgi:sugar (pentulose or hexulose) kinase
MAHAVGIDVGTTNVKAALVSDDGTLVASASRFVSIQRSGDGAEQPGEPDEVARAVVRWCGAS